MSFKEGVKRKEGLCFVGKKIGSQTKTFVRISKRKTSFWERRKKNQEQGEIARRGIDFYSLFVHLIR